MSAKYFTYVSSATPFFKKSASFHIHSIVTKLLYQHVTPMLHNSHTLKFHRIRHKSPESLLKIISDIAHIKNNSVYLRKITVEKKRNTTHTTAFLQPNKAISLASRQKRFNFQSISVLEMRLLKKRRASGA